MRTRLFLICSLFGLLTDLHSQFFGFARRSSNYYSTVLEYPKDGNYRVFTMDNSFPPMPSKGEQIRVYNTNHLLIDSISLIRGAWPIESSPLKLGDRLFWPVYYWDTTTFSPALYRLAIMELDTLFNFISYHNLSGLSPDFGDDHSIGLIATPNRLFAGKLSSNTSSPYFTSTIYKLNMNFQKLDSVSFNSIVFVETGHSFNNQLIFTTSGLNTLPCKVGAGGTQKLVLDTSLNIIGCELMDTLLTYTCGGIPLFTNYVGINSGGKAVRLSATKTVMLGKYTIACSFNFYPDIIVNCILGPNQTTNQIIKTNLHIDTYSNASYPQNISKYYSVQLPYIVSVGSIGYLAVDDPYYQKQKTKVFVNKIDTMGNVIWVREYGGDMNYYGRSIAFMPDGGSLIAGTRFDSTSMSNPLLLENFLLRLDINGNIISTGIFENGTVKWNLIRALPNPASNMLYFDIPFEEHAQIEITDINGIEILKRNDYKSMSSINVEDFANGIYFYRIKTGERAQAGKFVKN